MDESCSALDPIATLWIADCMLELEEDYSALIVAHNMQQAASVGDRAGFFNMELSDTGQRTGHLIEFE